MSGPGMRSGWSSWNSGAQTPERSICATARAGVPARSRSAPKATVAGLMARDITRTANFLVVLLSFQFGRRVDTLRPLVIHNPFAEPLINMDLSPTHLHLLLNHFPTVGFIIGLTLYVAALYANSDHLKQAALVIFVGVAIITIPTYASGNAAETVICVSELADPCADTSVSRPLIEEHE